jgi:hypothetical protein
VLYRGFARSRAMPIFDVVTNRTHRGRFRRRRS